MHRRRDRRGLALDLAPTATYGNNEDAGTAAPATPTPATTNHTGSSDSKTFTIAQRTLAVTAEGIDKVYDGNTTAAVTLSDDRVAGDVFTVGYSASVQQQERRHRQARQRLRHLHQRAGCGQLHREHRHQHDRRHHPARPRGHGDGVNKVYDGTTAATVTLTTDKVSGDTVIAAYTGAAFVNKNVAQRHHGQRGRDLDQRRRTPPTTT